MIGVVLMTHANLGEALMQNARGIIGEQPNVATLSQQPGISYQLLENQLSNILQELDSGSGVLILVDIYGGTPSNVALSFLESHPVAVVTGLNLAMLLKVLESNRDSIPLQELALIAERSAKNSIRPHFSKPLTSLDEPHMESDSTQVMGNHHEARATVTVLNKLGLHASTSAKLVKSMSRFQSTITLTKDDLTVDTKSIMGVLMLGAAQGTDLGVHAVGDDARLAVETIVQLFKSKFDED